LRNQGVFILGSIDACILLKTKEKNQFAKQSEFLWVVVLIGPFRNEMKE
jgi:hypothetical protein